MRAISKVHVAGKALSTQRKREGRLPVEIRDWSEITGGAWECTYMDDRVIYCKVDQESCECVCVNRVQLHVMRWMMMFNWLAAEGSCD